MTSSDGFQHHFTIISKVICYDGYMRKNVLKCNYCLSIQPPFELPFQLLLELEGNLLDQNVNELEFELSRMWMKQPYVLFLLFCTLAMPCAFGGLWHF